MAAPGTKTLDRFDGSRKHKFEYWPITSQPGGVKVQSHFKRILHTQATLTSFTGNPPGIMVVKSTDKKSVMVYTSTDEPVTIDIALMGDG